MEFSLAANNQPPANN